MRKPEFITFTGIDEWTDPDKVIELSKKYPVEWGILFSKKNTGNVNRYPSHEVVENYFDEDLKLSAHICGTYSNYIMKGVSIPELVKVLEGNFSRTQINVADGETDCRHLNNVYANRFANDIRAKSVIVQCRSEFPSDKSVDWLYDISGGEGRSPESWNAEADKTEAFCGYAGGIGVDNVLSVIEEINKTHPQDKPYWIDMEGKIRTNDKLDLNLCESILRRVYGEV